MKIQWMTDSFCIWHRTQDFAPTWLVLARSLQTDSSSLFGPRIGQMRKDIPVPPTKSLSTFAGIIFVGRRSACLRSYNKNCQ